jgi:glycolate dehydrogenase iron-sulfur subunit
LSVRQNEQSPAGQATQGFSGEDIPSFEILNTCVKCGLCLPTCPTYRETMREQSSPRGRIHLMQSVSEGRLPVLDPVFVEQAYECLDCRACEAVCPSGVRYGEVIEASRAQIERARTGGRRRGAFEILLRTVVFRGIFADLRLLRLLASLLRLYQCSGLRSALRRSGVLRVFRLDYMESQAPEVSARFLIPAGQRFSAHGQRRGRVALLAGCVMQTAFADIDRATIRLLVRQGWDVLLPSAQGCCGALHIHAGDADGGRERARHNISAFEGAGVDYIVNNAAGCGAALKEYDRLLADDPHWAGRAASFSDRVRDITELLATQPLRGAPLSLNLNVTYQDACHLAHAQGIAAAPRRLLQSINGLRITEMAEGALCCGSAGVYSLTNPVMSRSLRERKIDHAIATGANVIVSGNPGCILQLRAGLRQRGLSHKVKVRHIVELLDEAYGRAESPPPAERSTNGNKP